MLLAVMMVMPQGVKAQSVDGLTANQTFDFASLAQQSTTINWGDDYTGFTDNSPKYMGDINGTSLEGRFATGTKSGQGWFLRTDKTPIGLWGRKKLAFCGMWNGDRVRVTLAQGGIKFLEANSAKMNGSLVTEGQTVNAGTFVFAAARNGDVIIECTDNYTTITKVEFYNAYNGSDNNFSVSFNNPPTEMNVGDTYIGNNANITPSYVTPTFTSSNEAVASVNEYGVVTALKRGTTTITAKLDVGPEGATYSQHKSAQFDVKVNNPNPQPKYAYDPAIEVYDLTGHSTWNISEGENAGYSFYNYDAKYISNPYGYELNNRIAIQSGLSGAWSNSNGLHNNSGSGWRLIGISNLRDGDRVRITFTGDVRFSSDHNESGTTFNAAGKVFYDIDNDGAQDCEEDVSINQAWTNVESDAWYTMLEAGHLDIALSRYNTTITKIEIYSDRKAAYIDTDKGNGRHTLTFDGTGQLLEKTAYIPGLKIEFSDANSQTEYIHITQSDNGPVACGEDPKGFKMVLQNENKIPSTGTFYKFIPEVNGTLNIEFKALSVKYGNKIWDYDSSEETVTSDQCYYVMLDVFENDIYVRANILKGNGNYVQNFNNGFNLVKGHTYYFYGWWAHSTDGLNVDYEQINGSCGVAKLISATYQPAFQMPVLAAVGTNGMTSFNGSACSPQVTISGNPTNLSFEVKRTSRNISVNDDDISLDNGCLKISSITYNDPNKDKAGVILVKATAAEGEHVFALTIPYSAAYNTDANGNSEGHTWNFTDQPLEIGNYFSDFYAIAGISDKQKPTDAVLAAAGKNTSSTLYQEINKADGTTDWTYTYRQVGTNGTFKDPMFQNVYSMEGDNANMIWETEGLWFDTPSNKSAIMNETLGAANHSSEVDPDRYVAILPDASGKSSFTIPGLKQDDRVRIYMGSGDGSSTDACFFNITNARDAVYREISESDVYKAGGSYWDLSGTSYDYYAAYHFFAKADGPMTFKMIGGSMTKIYKIEIYRGARRNNNGVLGTREYFHSTGDGTSSQMYMHLHHRGKGETLANGTNVSNEMMAASGNISSSNITLTTNGNDLIWTVAEGTFGVAKMRLKCMEYNQKYVTDYADFNVTVGYKEKVNYPKTWDFTDMKTYSETDLNTEDTKYPVNATNIPWWDDAASYDLSMWDANRKMVLRTPGADNTQEIFHQNKNGYGNQLYANDKIIPDTKGLWFYFDNNDDAYNGCMQIAADGLHLANASYENGATCEVGVSMRRGWWNYKMVVPDVPSGAAVYLRMARDESVKEGDVTFRPWSTTYNKYDDVTEPFFYKKFQFGWMETKAEIGTEQTDICKYYQASDGTGDYIVAIKNTGEQSHLTFTLNGWTLKKLAVSEDAKTVNKYGWNTESRERDIDPSLTAYMTGKDFRTYIVTAADKEANTVTLTRIDGGSGNDGSKTDATNSNMKLIVPAATKTVDGNVVNDDGSKNACIIRYMNAEGVGEAIDIFGAGDGFHLFVPDMHEAAASMPSSNLLKAQLSNTSKTDKKVPRDETVDGNTYNNYAFTFKYKKVNDDGTPYTGPIEGKQAFYRIVLGGASSGGHQGYLSIAPTATDGSRAAVRYAAAASAPESYNIVFLEWDNIEQMKGDVNADGRFNKLDVNATADHLAGRPAGIFRGLADMNGDGKVDVTDLTLMIKKITNE